MDRLMYRDVPCIRIRGPDMEVSRHEVAIEDPVSLIVNGRLILTAMTSPVMLREYVTGYLFTERVISGPGDIESIRIEGNMVTVLTKNPFKVITAKKTVLSGCGGSASYLDPARLPKIRSDLKVTREQVKETLTGVLASALQGLTRGVHVVGLADRDRLIAVAEDIGRHNTLDRVIGHGLLNAMEFGSCYVVSSGKISSEMVRKCLVANIPVIVSRGATTSLAIEIGEKTGVTLVGFARGDAMNIYSHPERVMGAPPLPG
jgi:FdhD protein